MDSKERKEMEQYLIKEKDFSKYFARAQTWRYCLISKTPLVKLLNYLDKRWGDSIKKETEEVKLVKTVVFGKLETLASYPVIIGSFVTSLFLRDPTPAIIGGPLGVYLNWHGEIKWLNAEERIKELKIDSNKTIDKWFEKYSSKEKPHS